MKFTSFTENKETTYIDVTLQRMYQRRLLKLNEILIKYDIGEALGYQEVRKLLYYVIFFSNLMRKELESEDEDTKVLLMGIDIFRVNKEMFMENYKYNVVVFWGRNGRFVKAEIYDSLESYLTHRRERTKLGLEELKIEILPTVDHLVYLGKKIIEIGSNLGVLNIVVTRKPEFDPLKKDKKV